MTVAALTPSVSYLEDGVTLGFPAPFRYLDPTSLQVQRVLADGTMLTLAYGTEWTATAGATDAGGTVTLGASVAGARLTITRATPRSQTTDYTTNDSFPAESHEAALDRAMLIDQEQDVRLARTLQVPAGETAAVLPGAADRATMFLAFDAAGSPIVNPGSDGVGGALSLALASTATDALGAALVGYNDALTYPADTVGAGIKAAYQAALAAAADVNYRVATIAALKALTAADGRVAHLTLIRKRGIFTFDASNLSAEVAADTLGGLYIAPNSDATGASGAWVRNWDGLNGHPEWFGAVTNNSTGTIPADNLLALKACETLCPVVNLAKATYWVNDTWWINTAHVKVQGSTNAIEDSNGTMIGQTDATKSVVRIGGSSIGSLVALIFVHNVGVKWLTGPTPTVAEIDAPRGFDVRFNLACDLQYVFAYDALVGHYFYGNVNCKVRYPGVTRASLYGANDFFRGVWCGGASTLPGFAGQNASLFLYDINTTFIGAAAGASAATLPSVGMIVDGAFADLFVIGHETSSIPRALELDGQGISGQWDVHIEGLVYDQADDDGVIVIKNMGALAKVHFKGGYTQFNNATAQNRGLWIEDNLGTITFDNFQVLGGGDSRGVYVKNSPNVIFSENCVIEGPGYPATFDTGCPNATFLGQLFDGGNSSGGTRAALTVVGATGGVFAPVIRGAAGSFSEGVNLSGSAHVSATIDKTRIDAGAIASARTVVVNGVLCDRNGSYTATGVTGPEGAGVTVIGSNDQVHVPRVADFTLVKDAGTTASIADSKDGIVLSVTGAGAADRNALVEVATPGAMWEMKARLKHSILWRDYMALGLYAKDNTGKIQTFAMGHDAATFAVTGMGFRDLRWTNITTFSAVAAQAGFFHYNDLWMRLRLDATTFHFEISPDGDNWGEVYQVGKGGFLGATIDKCGVFLGVNQLAAPQNTAEKIVIADFAAT